MKTSVTGQKWAIRIFTGCLLLCASVVNAQDGPLIPRVDSDWWTVATISDLGESLLYTDIQASIAGHGFFKSADGGWQLWASVRRTKEGSGLYAWEKGGLDRVLWNPLGMTMQGLSQYNAPMERTEKEQLLSPSFIRHDNSWYAFMGGQGKLCECHKAKFFSKQICVAVSDDGRNFSRSVVNPDCAGMVFEGPGQNRDPMIVKIGGLYHCYYYSCIEQGKNGVIAVRTSTDCVNWSDYTTVKQCSAPVSWYTVAPCVVERDGYYYLFLTRRINEDAEHKRIYQTRVYASTDPMKFGEKDNGSYIALLDVSAAEIFQDGGQWYISDATDGKRIRLAKLSWEMPQLSAATGQ
jgi:hypothetical protein